MSADDRDSGHVNEEPTAPPPGETDPRPWWCLEPDELAARYGWDADALMGALNPEDFNDQQATLALAAIACCRDHD